MSLSWTDCQIPESEDSVDGIRKYIFPYRLRISLTSTVSTYLYYVTRDVMWPTLDMLQSTSPTSYGTVLDLDRRLRELSMTSNIPGEEECTTSALDMQWYLTTQTRYVGS